MSGACAGRVAVVTGASRGIGAAIARRLAAEGARVAVTARTLEPDPRYEGTLLETVAAIEADGGVAAPFRADLAVEHERVALIETVQDQLGPIDILVNNAAVTFLHAVDGFPQKRYALMFEVQVRAPFELAQLVIPGMVARQRGWILNVSSGAAVHPTPPYVDWQLNGGFTVYGMCKAALERFSTGLAAELIGDGVAVNALSPVGVVPTSGATAHDLVGDNIEAPDVMAEAALQLVSRVPRSLTGRIAYSAHLLDELGVRPAPLG